MMKIILLSAIDFPYGSASVNRLVTFAKGFILNNIDTEIVLYRSNADKSHPIENTGKYNGVKYRYLHKKIYRKKYKITRILNYVTGHLRLVYYLRNEKKKYKNLTIILVSSNTFSFSFVGLCAKLFKFKFLLEVCEYPPSMLTSGLKNVDFNKLKQKYRKPFDGIIFETERLEKFFSQFLSPSIKTIVIPATLEYEDIIACPKSGNQNYIAYCGKIHSEEKDGLKNVIKSFQIVSGQDPTLFLYFVGRISNENYFNELKKLSRSLGVHEKVFFTRFVERQKYVEYLVNAQVLVVAKGNESYYTGGLTSKVVEYLFAKVPIVLVGSDDYAVYLENGKDALFSSSDNPQDIANLIIKLLFDKEYAYNIAVNGYNKAFVHFDYKKLSDKLISFIK